jgi:hypothetical protein
MTSSTPATSVLETWVVKPDAHTVATDTSAALDVTGCDYVTFHIHVGTLGASGTIDLKVQSSATSGGSYADITGALITQITTADTSARIQVNLKGEHDFLKTVMVVGTAASDIAVLAVQHAFKQTAIPAAVAWVEV